MVTGRYQPGTATNKLSQTISYPSTSSNLHTTFGGIYNLARSAHTPSIPPPNIKFIRSPMFYPATLRLSTTACHSAVCVVIFGRKTGKMYLMSYTRRTLLYLFPNCEPVYRCL